MRTRLSLSLAAVCLLPLPSARVSAQSTAEARKAWDAGVQQTKRQFLKCDAQGLADGVTEDYKSLDMSGHVTSGRAAEFKGDREFCAANTVTSWNAKTTDFHSSGPMAWAAGTMSMTYKVNATGKVKKIDGRFLTTMIREPDKKWRQQYWVLVPISAKNK
jgi:ketosteroid isomerase-like protein